MKIRKTALELLMKSLYGNYFSQDLLEGQRGNFDSRDFNFLQELFLGTLKNSIYLEYLISKKSKIPVKKIQLPILNIIKLAYYQAVFLDRVPNYAIANESVKLAKKYGNKGAAAFVNGVVRSFLREENKLQEPDIKDDISRLSIKYSQEENFTEIIVEKYGYEFAKEMFASLNERSNLNVRYSFWKISREDFEDKLRSLGYEFERSKLTKSGYRILNPTGIFQSALYTEGYFYAQDDSSILVSEILNPQNACQILDMCAAPGGKASHLAGLMGGKGQVIAFDKDKKKVDLIKKNMKRLGLRNVQASVGDGLHFKEELRESFDYVLLDAPCSALGLMRRFPEIKYKKDLDDIKELAKIQAKLIKNAGKYLKKGGFLVYSTCTITSEENEKVINGFLKENADFSIDKIGDKDFLRIFPQDFKSDGFTITRLVKNGYRISE